jgi:predicted GNAT family N-acyltransferase
MLSGPHIPAETPVISIERISKGHPLYPQVCTLREDVLLRPLGLDLEWFRKSAPGVEERTDYYIARVDHPDGARVIGCAGLLPSDPPDGSARLIQMAVNLQRQGEGIGRRLVVAAECRAFGELGLRELYCHAQVDAAGFYRALGWEQDSDIFDEAGIPHVRMALRQPAEEGQAM